MFPQRLHFWKAYDDHHSKPVNIFFKNWPTEQNIEVPDNFHFIVSYFVPYPSSIKYAGRSDVWRIKILETHWYELCIMYYIFFNFYKNVNKIS